MPLFTIHCGDCNESNMKQTTKSWNSTGEIGRIGRHRAETHRYFNIRFVGQMPPDASDFPGGIPAIVERLTHQVVLQRHAGRSLLYGIHRVAPRARLRPPRHRLISPALLDGPDSRKMAQTLVRPPNGPELHMTALFHTKRDDRMPLIIMWRQRYVIQ